ncbi:MAG TPA: malate synthase A [Geminicoccaceae bacterium]|nr:malate synthase A [Geminicoccaceae bacterium]
MRTIKHGQTMPAGVAVLGPRAEGYDEILSPDALAFLAELERRFGPTRQRLLARRRESDARLQAGWLPDFLEETRAVRAADWRIAPVPRDLRDRRVEITGPVDRKMIVNALNCGASVYMADFEDATTPTWANLIEGQINLRDAIRRTIDFTDPDSRKRYRLGAKVATLLVRPRGWHLPEAHLAIDGQPMSGALFDFGLYVFHNAKELIVRGTGPYFYLPKLESHLEARLWNDVFLFAQERLGIPRGTIKATVLIETILAAFEMDEILHELREHSAGLNCGRWDYIFSIIKKFRSRPELVMPDRDQVTMTVPCMRSYSLLAIRTCHRRGAHAIGGMAAQIPIRDDRQANEQALGKVRTDKEREASDGHDGTWVAHPGLVPIAKEVFDQLMPGVDQIARRREDVAVTAADLLTVPEGTITERGLRHNLNVGVLYLEAWLRGSGCVPIYNLMEDAATAEISRAQVWQWRRHGARLEGGPTIDDALVERLLEEELTRIRETVGEQRYADGRFAEAAALLRDLVLADEFTEFLTLPAYERVTTLTERPVAPA